MGQPHPEPRKDDLKTTAADKPSTAQATTSQTIRIGGWALGARSSRKEVGRPCPNIRRLRAVNGSLLRASHKMGVGF